MTASNPPVNVQYSHLRAYVAGTGATGALIAGAAVMLLSLATFLAFSGQLPFGGSDSGGSTYVGSSPNPGSTSAGAPARVGAALGAGTRAVAAGPASGVAGGQVEGLAKRGGSTDGPNGAGPSGSGVTPPDGGGPGSPTSAGPLTHAFGKVGQATGLDLSGPTGGVTREVDHTESDALDGAGGAAGQPHLGDDVGKAVNGLTDRLVGAGGSPGSPD